VPFVHANGVNLYTTRYRSGPEGERPLVVGIHGLGIVDHSSLAFTLCMPLARVADVIVYDLRGHGRSELVPSGYQAADHAEDLIALLEGLGIERPVHLVGGSYGGAVALTATVEHPDRVASLTMVEGLVPLGDWGLVFSDTFDPAYEQMREGFTPERAMEVLGHTSPRRAKAIGDKVARLLYDTTIREDVRREAGLATERYERITCPVLAMYGDLSPIAWQGRALRELVPQTQLHAVEGADHVGVFWQPVVRTEIADFRIKSEIKLERP
jgi:pimeloyl-ACP methyl ester carboxylesterase